jgi:hypothetical protein
MHIIKLTCIKNEIKAVTELLLYQIYIILVTTWLEC